MCKSSPPPSTIQILVTKKYTVNAVILASVALAPFAAATNFADCLAKIQNGTWEGDEIMGPNGTDNQGHSVPFSGNTTAITYHQCQ